jgi:hypothetical protein
MYPSNIHLLLGPAADDHRIRADIYAAAMRQREAGEDAFEARPSLAARLRAGVRVVTTRRAVAFG